MEITGVRDCLEGFLEEVFECFQDRVGSSSTRLPCEMGRTREWIIPGTQHFLGACTPPSSN